MRRCARWVHASAHRRARTKRPTSFLGPEIPRLPRECTRSESISNTTTEGVTDFAHLEGAQCPPRHLGYVQQTVHTAEVDEAPAGDVAHLPSHTSPHGAGQRLLPALLAPPLSPGDARARPFLRSRSASRPQARASDEAVEVAHITRGHMGRGHETGDPQVHAQSALTRSITIASRTSPVSKRALPCSYALVVGALLDKSRPVLILRLDHGHLDLIIGPGHLRRSELI